MASQSSKPIVFLTFLFLSINSYSADLDFPDDLPQLEDIVRNFGYLRPIVSEAHYYSEQDAIEIQFRYLPSELNLLREHRPKTLYGFIEISDYNLYNCSRNVREILGGLNLSSSQIFNANLVTELYGNMAKKVVEHGQSFRKINPIHKNGTIKIKNSIRVEHRKAFLNSGEPRMKLTAFQLQKPSILMFNLETYCNPESSYYKFHTKVNPIIIRIDDEDNINEHQLIEEDRLLGRLFDLRKDFVIGKISKIQLENAKDNLKYLGYIAAGTSIPLTYYLAKAFNSKLKALTPAGIILAFIMGQEVSKASDFSNFQKDPLLLIIQPKLTEEYLREYTKREMKLVKDLLESFE